jgi:outer membrane protein assembly factor BamB
VIHRFTLPFCLFAILCAAAFVRADDWPQWRGPARDAVSKETGLLKAWPAEGPKLLWQVDVGMGYSTPAVVGERIYLLSNQGLDDEFVRALNVSDGKPEWSQRIGKVGPNTPVMNYPGARSTPTVDGKFLYAFGSDGDLVCLETATGKPRWHKNVRTDFGGQPGDWAYTESPLVDGDRVVVTPGGGATMVALDKRTGDMVWRTMPWGDNAGYASAIAIEVGGVRQYVQFIQKGLVGVEAEGGKLLWIYDATAKNSPANIPTPVASPDGFVYSGAARSGGGLVRIQSDDERFAAKQVYFAPKLPVAIGGAVLVDNHLYGTGGPVLICAEFKTGKVKWTDRALGPSSILAADGRLYLHGENGEVALVEPSPEKYREHGRFTPPNAPDRGKSKAWAYPVVANGRLYIRDLGALWCYDISAP